MKKNALFAGIIGVVAVFGVVLFGCDSGSGNKEFMPSEPGLYDNKAQVASVPPGWAAAKTWLDSDGNMKDGHEYYILLNANETVAPTTINISDGWSKGVTITLGGKTTARTVQLADTGSLLQIQGKVTFIVGSNITLKGIANNTSVLVRANSGSTLVLKAGATITGNTRNGGSGGGVGIYEGAAFIMEGGSIANNTTDSGGGGVRVDVGGTFTMTGGSITNNTAGEGGGLRVDGSFTMAGGSITSNTTTNNGGGVRVNEGATFVMEGGTISDNNNTQRGGGVYAYKSSFTMKNGLITKNTVTNEGGGVRVDNGSFIMEGGSITDNEAQWGGGVEVYTSSFTMKGGSITNNTATNDGGGVKMGQDGNFTMEGGSITGNTAEYGGGVRVGNTGSSFTMQGGSITGNTATKSSGGGVQVYTGTTFNNNYPEGITGNTPDNILLNG
jgi:hypothetical protein